MNKRFELLIVSGENQGKRFAITEKGLRLGRSSSNDVFIPDEELSRNHCIFEINSSGEILVSDLASANGTYVNGVLLESQPRALKEGDVISVGSSSLRIVEEGKKNVEKEIDLGLGKGASQSAFSGGAGENASPGKKSLKMRILFAAVAIIMAASIAMVLVLPDLNVATGDVAKSVDAGPTELTSLTYEKIEANATRIFRYYLTIDGEGEISVSYDDIPEANRHASKKAKLNSRALSRIRDILETKGWSELEETYSGPKASEENELKSWRIRTVQGSVVRDILVENVPEPEAFKIVREALETFSRNELGMWAIQYSREQLMGLSAESKRYGDSKWEERDVVYGNLSAAIDAYREAIYYLETVNPKPEGYAELKECFDKARKELDERYKDQRFRADKAINLADWDTAHSELRILCDMVPNKNDPRHDEASAKLVDVENRIKKARAGKGGK